MPPQALGAQDNCCSSLYHTRMSVQILQTSTRSSAVATFVASIVAGVLSFQCQSSREKKGKGLGQHRNTLSCHNPFHRSPPFCVVACRPPQLVSTRPNDQLPPPGHESFELLPTHPPARVAPPRGARRRPCHPEHPRSGYAHRQCTYWKRLQRRGRASGELRHYHLRQRPLDH